MRLNIICRAPGWDVDCPGEVWGINELHLKRDVDVVIDVHDLMAVASGKKQLGRRSVRDVWTQLRNLKLKGLPVYTINCPTFLPKAIEYPIDEIIDYFRTDYFNSGVDYAMALALYKGYSEIHLYGVLMLGESEYAQQKPSCEYWIGRADKWADVKVHGGYSTLLKTPSLEMYGYDRPQKFAPDADPDKADFHAFRQELGV